MLRLLSCTIIQASLGLTKNLEEELGTDDKGPFKKYATLFGDGDTGLRLNITWGKVLLSAKKCHKLFECPLTYLMLLIFLTIVVS
jgi:hypothetical protein